MGRAEAGTGEPGVKRGMWCLVIGRSGRPVLASQRSAGLGFTYLGKAQLGRNGLGAPSCPKQALVFLCPLSLLWSLHIALSKLLAPLDLSPCPLVLSSFTDFYKRG